MTVVTISPKFQVVIPQAIREALALVPPGNRLESLKADRAGQFSIRLNDQLRICFGWTEAGPADVEITDYH